MFLAYTFTFFEHNSPVLLWAATALPLFLGRSRQCQRRLWALLSRQSGDRVQRIVTVMALPSVDNKDDKGPGGDGDIEENSMMGEGGTERTATGPTWSYVRGD